MGAGVGHAVAVFDDVERLSSAFPLVSGGLDAPSLLVGPMPYDRANLLSACGRCRREKATHIDREA